jgi:hypothetical protein
MGRWMFSAFALPLTALAAPAQVPAQPAAPADTGSVAAPETVSARAAFIRSLVLPGWGQAYVGAPGRGAVYFALESGSLWMTYKTWQELREAREAQGFLRESGRLELEEKTGLVESREEQLEDWITLSLFFLLFSGADAYVAAQLADFDEHVGIQPGADGLRLEVSLPLGARR